LPTLAKMATAGEMGALRTTYRRNARLVILGMPLLVGAAWVLGPRLIAARAPEYEGAIVPFRILAVSCIFMFMNQLSTTYLMALGRFRVVMGVAIVNLVVYVSVATALVPRFGARGAASATCSMEVLSMAIQLSIMWFLFRSSASPADGARSVP
jgi:O-antigen/teichoic acid export membrane protein